MRLHLSAGIAHQQHAAPLLEERGDALVVVDAAVHQLHREAALVNVIERQRLEDARHARGSGHRLTEADVAAILGKLLVVHPAQAIVGVDRVVAGGRRLAHPRGGELPVVPGVEAGGVQRQDRDLRGSPPVVVLRREARVTLGSHDQPAQPSRADALAVGHPREQLLLVELASADGA